MNVIGEFIMSFVAIRHNDRSNVVSIDSCGVSKRYLTSKSRSFFQELCLFDDVIVKVLPIAATGARDMKNDFMPSRDKIQSNIDSNITKEIE